MDKVRIKSNGAELIVWKISDPVMKLVPTNPRFPIPHYLDEVMSAEEGRKLVQDLMEEGLAKKVKP